MKITQGKKAGLGIRSLVFRAIHSFFVSENAIHSQNRATVTAPVALLSWMPWVNSSQLLFCNERPERFPQGCSFIKSNVIELLMSLFKKERLSKERRELFPLGHKKGEKLSITFGANHSSFRAIRLNQECITHVALLSWATWENCSWSLFC